MGFDSGGCLFWGHQREVMNYLVGGFCFGLNFRIVVPSGGKLWGTLGGQRLSLKKTVGTELMVLIGKLSQESMMIPYHLFLHISSIRIFERE